MAEFEKCADTNCDYRRRNARHLHPAGTAARRMAGLSTWRDQPVTMEFLADLFDAYCGAEGHNLVVMLASRPPAPKPTEDWVPLAKALFQIDRDPKIKDQAWFDFQGKAQRLIALMQKQ